MAIKPTTSPPTFVPNVSAPDVFADEASGFFLFNGNVRVTFASTRIDHSASPGPGFRVVIGRLVMPLAAAEAMCKGLGEFIEKTKAQVESGETQATPKPTLQ